MSDGRYATDEHIHVPRITHQILERKVFKTFVGSPDYSINNVNGLHAVDFVTSLVYPLNNPNALWYRIPRLYRENLYITNCDIFDKISTLAIIASAIVACVIFYRAYFVLDAHQVYVFNNPEDEKDPAKLAQLNKYNEQWFSVYWLIGKTALMGIPALIAMWQIFKRTSVHAKGSSEDVYPKVLFPKLWAFIRKVTSSSQVSAF